MNELKTNKGVIYLALGDKYIKEAILSAKSLKKHNPSLHISLYTNKKIKNKIFNDIKIIKENPKNHRIKRIKILKNSPYNKTLYLDNDTYILEDISEIYDLLEKYDFAAAHAPKRIFSNENNIPHSFPELNAGVLLFQRNKETKNLFNLWQNLYTKLPEKNHDQTSLRRALWDSIIKITILPTEYNIRKKSDIQSISTQKEPPKIKIIHMKEIHKENMIKNFTKEFNKQTKLKKPFPSRYISLTTRIKFRLTDFFRI